MRIGDIVRSSVGERLRSGFTAYGAAVCVSVEPFMMTSEDGDMLWTQENSENYVSVGYAPAKIVNIGMQRIPPHLQRRFDVGDSLLMNPAGVNVAPCVLGCGLTLRMVAGEAETWIAVDEDPKSSSFGWSFVRLDDCWVASENLQANTDEATRLMGVDLVKIEESERLPGRQLAKAYHGALEISNTLNVQLNLVEQAVELCVDAGTIHQLDRRKIRAWRARMYALQVRLMRVTQFLDVVEALQPEEMDERRKANITASNEVQGRSDLLDEFRQQGMLD